MFVQVIRGKVKDPIAMEGRLESWQKELAPGAKGWLGATMGTTGDGTYINVVRFESEEAAKANSARPEQGEWFAETKKLFEGEPSFYNCPEVDLFMGGGSDAAGFVQVMIYKPTDAARIRELGKEMGNMGGERPDILGGLTAFATDGTVIDTIYFSSEAEAREGEKKEQSPAMQAVFEEFQKLAGDVQFLDLGNPRLISA